MAGERIRECAGSTHGPKLGKLGLGKLQEPTARHRGQISHKPCTPEGRDLQHHAEQLEGRGEHALEGGGLIEGHLAAKGGKMAGQDREDVVTARAPQLPFQFVVHSRRIIPLCYASLKVLCEEILKQWFCILGHKRVLPCNGQKAFKVTGGGGTGNHGSVTVQYVGVAQVQHLVESLQQHRQ